MGAASVIWSEYPQCLRAAFGKSPVGLYPVGLYIVEPGRRAYARVRIASLPGALLSRFFTGGCAYQLDTAISKTDSRSGADRLDRHRTDRQVTAANWSRRPKPIWPMRARSPADVVGHGAKDTSIPWENPNTGAGGNITPLAASYSEGS